MKKKWISPLLITAVFGFRIVAAHAQDAQSTLNQLTSLMSQMQTASDPCPFMPKIKALINQIAQENPQVYQAMKPSLDEMSKDDGCSASAVAPAPPQVTGSGTAPPPQCVDMGGGTGCVTPAQAQQIQAERQREQAQMQVCPASGFVPGAGHWAACDAYLGERLYCTPGQRVPVAKAAPPPASCGPSAASVGTGTGSRKPDGPGEAGCVRITRDGQGYPVFQNTCSFRVRYFWTPLNRRKGEFAEQNGYLDPGEINQGAEGNGEEVRVYACQDGYLVRDINGQPITGVVAQYRCVAP